MCIVIFHFKYDFVGLTLVVLYVRVRTSVRLPTAGGLTVRAVAEYQTFN